MKIYTRKDKFVFIIESLLYRMMISFQLSHCEDAYFRVFVQEIWYFQQRARNKSFTDFARCSLLARIQRRIY